MCVLNEHHLGRLLIHALRLRLRLRLNMSLFRLFVLLSNNCKNMNKGE